MFVKKITAFLLVLCTVLGVMAFTAGCGEDAPQKINCQVEFSLSDGTVVQGVEIAVKKGDKTIASGVSDESGVVKFKAEKGNYSVVVTAFPAGATALEPSFDIAVSSANKNAKITLIKSIGSIDEPDSFVPDSNGAMLVTLPAKSIHYLVVYRSRGREMTFAGQGYTVVFNGEEKTVSGSLTITLNGTAMDTYSGSEFAIINLSDSAITVGMTLHDLPEEEIVEEE